MLGGGCFSKLPTLVIQCGGLCNDQSRTLPMHINDQLPQAVERPFTSSVYRFVPIMALPSDSSRVNLPDPRTLAHMTTRVLPGQEVGISGRVLRWW